MKIKFLLLVSVLFCWSTLHLFAETQRSNDSSGKTITSENYCNFLNAVAATASLASSLKLKVEVEENQTADYRLQTASSEEATNHSDRFLGTITASNLNDLYDERMLGAFIMRTGLPGNYCYNLIRDASTDNLNSCIAGLSWNDAERYCEWKNSTSTFNLSRSAIGTATVDPLLKSNQLTFRLVSSAANAYEAGGEEVAEALEAIGDEELIGLASILFFGGMVMEGSESALRGPGTHSVDLVENNRLASSERPNISGSLLREPLLDASDPLRAAFLATLERPAFDISNSSEEEPLLEGPFHTGNCIPESFVDAFVKEHEATFLAFEQMKWRSNSDESLFEDSSFHHIVPLVPPLIAEKNSSSFANNNLREGEGKSDIPRKSTSNGLSNQDAHRLSISVQKEISKSSQEDVTLTADNSHLSAEQQVAQQVKAILKEHKNDPEGAEARTETVTTDFARACEDHRKQIEPSASSMPEPGEKQQALCDDSTVKLPKTGLTIKECTDFLNRFARWKDAIPKYDALKKEVNYLSWKADVATKQANYYIYPDKKAIHTRDIVIKGLRRSRIVFNANIKTIENLARELDSSVKRHIFYSGNTKESEDYLLHNCFSGLYYDYSLQWAYLNRQAMLNQGALFEKEGYWLDFSDPLRGPFKSRDEIELTQRVNQAHSNFMEAAVIEVTARLRSLFKPPFTPSVESIIKNNSSVYLKAHSTPYPTYSRDLTFLIRTTTISKAEIKNRSGTIYSNDVHPEWKQEFQSEIKDAKDYFDFIFGTKTTINTDEDGKIKASWPYTRKYCLAQQFAYYSSGKWTLLDGNRRLFSSNFPSQKPIEQYVDLFHKQSIKAASLLDQYRIIKLPDEEMLKEATRLQALSPEKRETELFQRAGIEDWELPTTPTGPHAYDIMGEAEKSNPTEQQVQASSVSSNYTSSFGSSRNNFNLGAQTLAQQQRSQERHQAQNTSTIQDLRNSTARNQAFMTQQRQNITNTSNSLVHNSFVHHTRPTFHSSHTHRPTHTMHHHHKW